MDRCIIWDGEDYEKIINPIMFEELKGNLQILAISTVKNNMFGKKRDGYPVVCREEIKNMDFDYLIIANFNQYVTCIREAVELGVSRKQIINGRVFVKTLFDYQRYIALIKNPVTILSDDCWGGFVYHDWSLPFTSPCVNLSFPRKFYIRFIQDPFYYLEQPLMLERECDFRKNDFPIGKIGENQKEITIEFPHARSFQEAAEQWNRRKKRINKDRIFVKLGFNAHSEKYREILEGFNKVKYNKICFLSRKTEIKDVLYLKRFEYWLCQGDIMDTIDFNLYCHKLPNLYKDVDILKLLNGEKDFLREI